MMFQLPDRLPPGSLLDGYYEIVEHIGEGGFADVYSGIQQDTGSEIAIKVLKPEKSSKSKDIFERRFVQEARLAARIRHRNVTTVFACRQEMKIRLPSGEEGQTGRLYIVMDLLHGRTLEDELRNFGAMPPRRAIPLVIGSLDGLAKGHELGIVHKDLKPANLFLTDLGSRDETMKILDFGVARAGQSMEERLTLTGHLAMTPQYAAPEYLDNLIATPALDVYQMGLILVEMLVGHPMVQADSLVSCVMLHAKGVEVPAPLATSELGPILEKALQRKYKSRYPDAARFADALEALGPEQFESIHESTKAISTEEEQTQIFSDPSALGDATTMAFSGATDEAEATDDAQTLTPHPLEGRTTDVRADARVQTEQGPEAPPTLPAGTVTAEVAHKKKKRRGLGLAIVGVGFALLVVALLVVTGLLWASLTADDKPDSSSPKHCDGPKECFEVAEKAYYAPTSSRDYDKASKLFGASCDQGYAAACTRLGIMRFYGHGLSIDDGKVATLYRKGCKGGSAQGCSALGGLYWLGLGVKKDDKMAVKYMRKGCNGGDGSGCGNMGVFYALGITVKLSKSKAFEHYKTACRSGNAGGCQSVARAYMNGIGVKKSRSKAKKANKRAAKYAKKRCHLGEPEACRVLGNLYAEGNGVSKSPKKAAKFYDRSCKGGRGPGCTSSGVALLSGVGTKRDQKEAVARFRRACKRNDMDACAYLASFHYTGGVVEMSYVDAAHYYRKACKLGSAVACNNLGAMIRHNEIKALHEREMMDLFERAVDLYRRYCAAGSPDQCTRLGASYELGQGVPASRSSAFKYYELGCRGGDKDGCIEKARLGGDPN